MNTIEVPQRVSRRRLVGGLIGAVAVSIAAANMPAMANKGSEFLKRLEGQPQDPKLGTPIDANGKIITVKLSSIEQKTEEGIQKPVVRTYPTLSAREITQELAAKGLNVVDGEFQARQVYGVTYPSSDLRGKAFHNEATGKDYGRWTQLLEVKDSGVEILGYVSDNFSSVIEEPKKDH